MTSFRDRLPVRAPPRGDISPWSVLKHSVGKELTQITMPVAFNEPLSFLQRITENMEYYQLLVQASSSDNPVVRFELVTAFIISTLSSNRDRLNKPFNPLLGETFELQRDDYRVVCEQVSHHPPISALHATSPHITFDANICPKLRLSGTQVIIKPEGKMSLTLRRHNETYTWSHVNCVVHNIFLGKLWFEQQGEMVIACSQNNFQATIQFKQAGPDMRDLHRFEGFIVDGDGRKIRYVYGKWSEYVKTCPHADVEHSPRHVPEGSNKVYAKLNSLTRSLTVGATHSKNVSADENDLVYPNSRVIWESQAKPPHSADFYNLTLFALSLNELPEQEATGQTLPRTDCRFRPDIRKLEEGDLGGAAVEKSRLEELQRDRRKALKKERKSWKPLWFRENSDGSWTFTEEYWKRDFTSVPDIF